MLQSVESEESPGHVAPLCLGAGLLHVRDLVLVPESHVLEHSPQAPHSPQLPSTEKKNVGV